MDIRRGWVGVGRIKRNVHKHICFYNLFVIIGFYNSFKHITYKKNYPSSPPPALPPPPPTPPPTPPSLPATASSHPTSPLPVQCRYGVPHASLSQDSEHYVNYFKLDSTENFPFFFNFCITALYYCTVLLHR